MSHQCVPCNLSFKDKKCLQQHYKCKRHIRISESILENRRFVCNVCGKRYSIRQSLHAHKQANTCKAVTSTSSIIPGVEEMQKILVNSEKKHIDQNAILETMQKKFDVQQKQIEAMQKKIDEICILLLRNANKQEVTIDSHCAQEPESNKKRKKINKAVRQQVLNQQENACGACKLALTPYYEIDHIIGLQFGGTDDESNLMALCRECHGMKSIAENQCRDQIKDAIKTIVREKLGIEK